MLRSLLSLSMLVAGLQLVAQNNSAIQHPGVICCPQEICPGDSIAQISESIAPVFTDSVVGVEYAWFELLLDSTTANGTKWVRVQGANQKDFQPDTIKNPYGGFFMRAIKETGTLYFQFSNIVTVRELSGSSVECSGSSSTDLADAQSFLKAYPNPAENHIRFENQSTERRWANLELIRPNGQVIEQVQLGGESIHFQPISQYSAGIYYARFLFEDGYKEIIRWVKM